MSIKTIDSEVRIRLINSNFIVFFSDKKLNSIIQKEISGYEYELGPNKVNLSIPEYEDTRYLKILSKYFKKYVDITIYVSKKPIEESDTDKENYYSIMFKRSKLKKIFNEGICRDMEESTIDISFDFDDYEVRY